MIELRFAKLHRLADGKAIAQVFKRPRFKVQNRSGLILARSNGLKTNRIVVIVGKKNIRRAVDRNRVKRIVRESFRNSSVINNNGLISSNGCDIVFVARKGALDGLWETSTANQLIALWIKLENRAVS